MATALPLILFPFCLIAAAMSDARRFKIPNELSIVLIAGFAVAAILVRMPLSDVAVSVATAGIVLAAGFALFYFDIFGAGDAKLLTAIALWFSWPSFLTAIIYITIAGGALSLGILMLSGFARSYPGLGIRIPPLARLAATPRSELKAPYGIAIAVGSLLAFNESPLFQALVDAMTQL